MSSLKIFLKNIGRCFLGRNLYWHALAIALTYIFVMSGFDWFYFLHTRSTELRTVLFPAVILGGLLPILLPVVLLIFGTLRKNSKTIRTAWILAQSEIIAYLLSAFYKAFTGRLQPSFSGVGTDISHMFRFGFMKGGIFWGWPSSHTTVAFAAALTLVILYPQSKVFRALMLAYALYVGIGVSTTIHWFSEFVAGAIFGSMVGWTVTKNTLKK